VDFEGVRLVVADVNELPSVQKPCYVRNSGKAYLRAHDGDYAMSQVEIQAFIANRTTPLFDQAVPPGASREDLDPDLVEGYIRSCRESSASLRRLDDEGILLHTGVVAGRDGAPTVAGLLALGIHPQRFLPNAVIQASVGPMPGDPPDLRARDSQRFDGPIPLMLDEALLWVARNTKTRIRFGADGHGRDEQEYPPDAVRELIANALVHRDLGPYALSQAITLKLERDQLLISNPGGLWGLSVDRLGTVGVTSARNGYLIRICQNVRVGRDRRVIEALASGIPTVLRALHNARMAPPRFHDQGIRFTVRVPNHVLLADDDISWLARHPAAAQLTDVQRHVLVAMRHGTRWTNKTLREAFPMDSREATNVLMGLVRLGAARPVGDGAARGYEFRDPAAPSPRPAPAGTTAQRARSTVGRRENAEKLYRLLADHGSAGIAELAQAANLTTRQATYALALLREESRVSVVTEEGKASVYSAAT
jgi:ATP-dependent DNA helicase RecG